MTAISRNIYIEKLADIVNEYNTTNHITIKIKPSDVKSNTYIDFGVENYDKDLKFLIVDHIRISRCGNIFVKCYTPNSSEKIFVIKKLEILFCEHIY